MARKPDYLPSPHSRPSFQDIVARVGLCCMSSLTASNSSVSLAQTALLYRQECCEHLGWQNAVTKLCTVNEWSGLYSQYPSPHIISLYPPPPIKSIQWQNHSATGDNSAMRYNLNINQWPQQNFISTYNGFSSGDQLISNYTRVRLVYVPNREHLWICSSHHVMRKKKLQFTS